MTPSPSPSPATAPLLALTGLGAFVLYHAGAQFWSARWLTLAGFAFPVALMADRLGWREDAPGALRLLAALLLAGMAGAFFSGPGDATAGIPPQPALGYVYAMIGVQIVLVLAWWAWWWTTGQAVAIVGWATCAVGIVGAVRMHLMLGDPAPPSPWDATHDGPVAIAELFPAWLSVEGALFGAIMLAAAVAWAQERRS